MFFWVVVGRWCYSEVGLFFPSVLPVIDKTLEAVSLPTHDQWPDIQLEGLGQESLVTQIFRPIPKEQHAQRAQPSLSLPSFEKLDRQGLDALLESLANSNEQEKQKSNRVSKATTETKSKYY